MYTYATYAYPLECNGEKLEIHITVRRWNGVDSDDSRVMWALYKDIHVLRIGQTAYSGDASDEGICYRVLKSVKSDLKYDKF